MSAIHVILGSGNVGTKLALKLGEKGHEVRILSRNSASSPLPGVKRVEADASSLSSMLHVAPKADYVYNCLNPRRYDKWHVEWPQMSKAINEYVMSTEAVLVTCSNLYGYGPHRGTLNETLPLLAHWKNGRVRAEMWLETKALHDAGKLRATEVRASDYICASDQSRMGDRVVPNLINGKSIRLLGSLHQLHTWTDPDDVAELMKIVAVDSRAWGKAWHVPSNEPRTQLQVVEEIARELQVKLPKVTSVPALMERLLGLVNPTVKELRNTSYQFNQPFIMSDRRARETFGLRPKPWQQVIKDLVATYER